jgi:hypothetical protein
MKIPIKGWNEGRCRVAEQFDARRQRLWEAEHSGAPERLSPGGDGLPLGGGGKFAKCCQKKSSDIRDPRRITIKERGRTVGTSRAC